MHNTCNMKHRSSTFQAVPFTIAIAADVLDDLKDRITRARIPEAVHGIGWTEGMDMDALRAVLAHWRSFDWRSAEAAINRVPAFRVEVDGYDIHFVHVRGEGTARVPLILTNGWPSCFTELLPLVPLLTKQVDGLSFDVVIPSLPGYGFSARPNAAGTNITRIADLWSKLMAGLGYDRFVAHGSDMGSGVAERLRANHASRMMGIHLINVNWFYQRPDGLSPEEEAYLDTAQQWQQYEGAYTMIHSSKPQTIASA